MTTAARLAACASAAILAAGCASPGKSPAASSVSGEWPPAAAGEGGRACPGGTWERVEAAWGRLDDASRVKWRERRAALLLDFLREDPSDLALAARLALAEMEGRGPIEARRRWKEARESDPADAAACLVSAMLAPGGCGSDEGLAALADACARFAAQGGVPPRLVVFRADCLEDAGRPDDAEDLLVDALILHPGDARLLNHLAYLWAKRDMELKPAEALVGKALAIDPGNPAYLDTLGWVYYREERYEDAVRCFDKALGALEKPDATILEHLADAFFAVGDDSAAISLWLDALAADPARPKVVEKLRLAWASILGALARGTGGDGTHGGDGGEGAGCGEDEDDDAGGGDGGEEDDSTPAPDQ